jgi:hypothetical protein
VSCLILIPPRNLDFSPAVVKIGRFSNSGDDARSVVARQAVGDQDLIGHSQARGEVSGTSIAAPAFAGIAGGSLALHDLRNDVAQNRLTGD